MDKGSRTRKLLGLGKGASWVLGQDSLYPSLGCVEDVGGWKGFGLFHRSSWSLSETGDIYIWGWNESGQLALPIRNPTEDKRVSGAGKVKL